MPPPDADVLSVSDAASLVKEALEANFPTVWISGEVSNLVRAGSGHVYLTLKDAAAQLKCAFFRGFALRLKFDPRNGMEVVARGRISFFPQKGDAQFYIEEMHPKGVGAAELALRQLKEKLLARGYFDPRRKRPLPAFPRRVALVASATGAAVRDMVELFAQRWPLCEVIVRHSRVQGDGAAEEVAAAVRLLGRLHEEGELPLDAIVLGRGGGSAEDLWAFNEEVVADAIFGCPVPVVSAVGHETDVTVADLVADKRAETPSAAVVLLTPDRRELLAGLLEARTRLSEAVRRRIETGRERLDQIAGRPAFRKPLERVREREQRLDELSARLTRAVGRRVEKAKDKLAAVTEQLDSLSPLNVLKRGYCLTLTADGEQVIRDPTAVSVGDRIVSRLANGRIVSRVEATEGERPA